MLFWKVQRDSKKVLNLLTAINNCKRNQLKSIYLKVLVSWRNKSSPTVKKLLEMIETAQPYVYLDSRVWETLRKFVSPDLLPSTASFTYSAETSDSPPEKGQVLNIIPVNLF